MKKKKYEIWNCYDEVGLEFSCYMDALDYCIDYFLCQVSQSSEPFFFSLIETKTGKLLRTIKIQHGLIDWVIHSKGEK